MPLLLLQPCCCRIVLRIAADQIHICFELSCFRATIISATSIRATSIRCDHAPFDAASELAL